MLAGLLLLAGCMPVVQQLPGAPPPDGPMVEMVIVNRMDRDATISFEFAGTNTSGGGEGSVPACTSSQMGFGTMGDHLSFAVDGEKVFDGDLPVNVGNGSILLRLDVAADGQVTVVGPVVIGRPPQVPPNPVGCG